MKVAVLASGSKGNCTFIELDGVKIIIDAGISARRVVSSLAELGEDISSLDAVFVTHEHSDHVSGLGAVLRRSGAALYTRPGTLAALGDDMRGSDTYVIHDKVAIGNVEVSAFPVMHDAADAVGYSVVGSGKVTVATDLGCVTNEVQKAIEGSDVLVFEANHDGGMLRRGSYPWSLKQRILGRHGHLSNSEAARTLSSMRKIPEKIFLAHLSEENNRPEIAEEAVAVALRERGACVSGLKVASQDSMVL